MSAFAVVVIVVCVVAIAIAIVTYLRSREVSHGRHGGTWLDHQEDIDVAERPSEDDRDAPIPKRPLRGRPE